MNDTPVLYERRGDLAVLTLNDAERLNPLGDALQQGLIAGLQRVRDDTAVRALLLTARGRGFCVGADLTDFAARSATLPAGETLGTQVGRMMATRANGIIEGLRQLPVPVVCALNGVAAGGGVGLALAADLVVAARSAYFYLPFVPALGLVPDMGASWALPRAVGRARALGLALTGDKLPAEKAAQWGLIWDCVDDAALDARATALATQLAALPAHAVAESRALFAAAEANPLVAQLALERERQQALIDRDSFAEGLRAFGERRAPVFAGRAAAKREAGA